MEACFGKMRRYGHCRSFSCFSSGSWRKLKSRFPSRKLAKIYFLVFINMFSSSFAITMLFPYLPFLMEFLIPRLKDDEKAVGRYIGFVAGAIFMGRVFGSYMWGVIADSKGRKPVIIVSSLFVGLFSLAFGFSINFPMAIILRFFVGFANGVVTTCKAVISEVSDDSNQAIGLAFLGAAWSTGYIIGPAVSGAIADPIGQYNLSISNSFLRGYLTQFPYSLPSVFSALLFVFSTLLTVLFLPETKGTKKNRKRSEVVLERDGLELASLRARHLGNGTERLSNGVAETSIRNQHDDTDETSLLGTEEPTDAEDSPFISSPIADAETRTDNLFISNPITGANGAALTNGDSVGGLVVTSEEEVRGEVGTELAEAEAMLEDGHTGEVGTERGKAEEMLVISRISRNKRLTRFKNAVKNLMLDLRLFLCCCTSLNSLLIYCVYSFASIGFYELYSLWAYTSPHLGGLGFSLHDIGISLTIIGIFMIPITILVFPLMEKYLKAIKSFYVISISLTFLLPLLPNLHYLASTKHTWLLWISLITLGLLINGMFSVGFSTIFLFINNSVTFDKLGSINGIAMMLTSITRGFAPVIFGTLFSVSLSDAALDFGFPIDFNLSFLVLSLVMMVTVLMAALLPVSINHQMVIEDV